MNEVPINPDVVDLLAALAPPVPVFAGDFTAEQHRQGGREAMAYFTRDAVPAEVHQIVDDVVPSSVAYARTAGSSAPAARSPARTRRARSVAISR